MWQRGKRMQEALVLAPGLLLSPLRPLQPLLQLVEPLTGFQHLLSCLAPLSDTLP